MRGFDSHPRLQNFSTSHSYSATYAECHSAPAIPACLTHSAQPVQAVDIRFCAGLDDVGGSTATHHPPFADLQVDSHLSHRFGAFGYGSNVIAQEFRRGRGDTRNRLVDGIDRPVAN